MKLPIFFLGLAILAMPAFADDAVTSQLTERKSCSEIASEIATLSEITNLDEATTERLKQLQVQQRSYCVAKSAGRRAVARTLPTIVVKAAETASAATTTDALGEYLAAKKSNCDKLKSEIDKVSAENNDTKADALAAMRGMYDMDCVDKTDSTPTETAITKTDEEWAAEYDANLAAGLCGDGSTPNKYGCCADEVFKDLGDLVFACCPKSGGKCFPPIK